MKFLTILVIALAILGAKCAQKVNLDESNYQQQVLDSKEVWLIDYYSEMCGSCKEFAPIYDKLADHFQNQLKIGKVNIDQPKGMNLAQKQDALNDGIPCVKLVYGASGKSETLMAGDVLPFNNLKNKITKKLADLNIQQNSGSYTRKSDL